MARRRDGGPAFPLVVPGGFAEEGISVRDFFAIHAPPFMGMGHDQDAESRYRWAEAMLAEKNKRDEADNRAALEELDRQREVLGVTKGRSP